MSLGWLLNGSQAPTRTIQNDLETFQETLQDTPQGAPKTHEKAGITMQHKISIIQSNHMRAEQTDPYLCKFMSWEDTEAWA